MVREEEGLDAADVVDDEDRRAVGSQIGTTVSLAVLHGWLGIKRGAAMTD